MPATPTYPAPRLARFLSGLRRSLLLLVGLLLACDGRQPAQVTENDPAIAAPAIRSFLGPSGAHPAGQPAQLSWDVVGAGRITIQPEPGEILGPSPTGVVSVRPSVTTTYILTATNTSSGRSSSASWTVVVYAVSGLPTIRSFVGPSGLHSAGEPAQLSWEVTDATRLSIRPDPGDLASFDNVGSVTVRPLATTTYTLTASNALGASTATTTVTIALLGPPTVRSFVGPSGLHSAGEPAQLSWDVVGASRLSIQPDPGDLADFAPAGLVSVRPLATTTYTLTAGNALGTTTATTTVAVTPLPVIHSFVGPSGSHPAGESAQLSWNVEGATRLVIQPGPGPIPDFSPVGFVAVRPAVTTTYTLTASNGAGTVAAEATVQVDTSGARIEVSPTQATTSVGLPVSLTAAVTGLTDPAVLWSSSPAEGVTLSQSAGGGPSCTFASAGTYLVRATSRALPSLWAEATVTVLPEPVVIVLTPPSTIVKAMGTQVFTASISGTTDPRLAWSCSGGGTVTPGIGGSAVFQASELPGTFRVTANSPATTGGSPTTASVTVPDHTSYLQFHSLTYTTLTLSRTQIPAGGEPRRFMAMATGTSPGGAASFNGGWDWEVPTGAGSVRTVAYSCVQGTGTTCSAIHTLEWRIPADIPLGTHVLRLHPWSDPTQERTLTLTVTP